MTEIHNIKRTAPPSSKRRTKWGNPRRPKWHNHPHTQFRYDVHGDGLSPFFVGMAAAEFLPADPQIWFDAAMEASLRFARWKDQVIIEYKHAGDRGEFLMGWLTGTLGGEQALADFMDARGIKIVALAREEEKEA